MNVHVGAAYERACERRAPIQGAPRSCQPGYRRLRWGAPVSGGMAGEACVMPETCDA